MRSFQQNKLLDIISVLSRACDELGRHLASGDGASVMKLLQSCQQAAARAGQLLEESGDEGAEVIRLIGTYAEEVYALFVPLAKGEPPDAGQAKGSITRMREVLSQAKELISVIPIHREVVFLPYKASMWDSLESVWRREAAEPDCTALVIPIPYYDRNPDGSFGELHDESGAFPADVPITQASDYDFGERRPDTIYIHNPYDDYNRVTSVHPFFYSSHLKEFTDELVYIPYFVLGEPDPENEEQLEGMAHFVTVPAIKTADRVIVQSEAMREAYIRILTKAAGEETRPIWEKKIEGTGSPKFDRVEHLTAEDQVLPEAWRKLIEREDGTKRKVILYNTGITAMLEHDDEMMSKIRDNLTVFYENREDVILLWRPHPLMEATLASMRPQLLKEWRELVAGYREAGWGIYDDTPDLDRAIAITDAYYGDWSSVVQLYQKTGKPIMIQNPEIRTQEEE